MFPENRALADSYGNSSVPQPVVVQRFSSLEDSHLVGPLRDIGFAVPSMNPANRRWRPSAYGGFPFAPQYPIVEHVVPLTVAMQAFSLGALVDESHFLVEHELARYRRIRSIQPDADSSH